MNDIEKQIEGIEEPNKEEIKIKPNRNMDKKKLTYILLGVLVLVIIGAVIYLVIINKDNNNDKPNNNDNNQVEDKDKDKQTENLLSYVSCEGNTALLNVRNSTSGDIIDGLSCYQTVKIEEELDGTEACDKWYKISYQKRGNNYTGYACGTYIKKDVVKESELTKVKSLIDKANDYYETTVLKPYCGKTTDEQEVEFKGDDGSSIKLKYVKSEYSSVDEIKDYVATFADPSLFKLELKLSDINNPKQYDNYYEIAGDLYCRDYSGKGWLSYYTGNYNVEILSNINNKIEANISYEYLNEDTKCDLKELSKCSNSNFNYEIGKVTIQNDKIIKMNFHK